ncbi:cation diffusion facilitator family transporter [Risungbinella massiliensis]|uniref:cation diffusion facilitator family transporter n=1 Tax=Risungbinella massiliensis TaxID=1329796 RepID=UPI000B0559E7|nr:cation diffusion facilitator family transporter [Risungbinella massiliensis]
MHNQKSAKLNQSAALLSIFSYICLSILKLTIGYIAHSEALTADGWNNSTDILASVAVLIGLRLAVKPPDSDHPYGHRRAETISSLVASFIMFVVGLEVLFSAGQKIVLGPTDHPDPIAIWVCLFGALVMGLVYQINVRIAKKTQSQAVMAAAKDNLSDALVSIGAAIGIIAAQFQMAWLDSITALIVGLIILKTAYDIFQESSHNLSDGINTEVLDQIYHQICQIEGVSQVADIKGRVHGKDLLLDIDIHVHPELTVYESHLITEEMEDLLKRNFQISHIQIHVEPQQLTCGPPFWSNE